MMVLSTVEHNYLLVDVCYLLHKYQLHVSAHIVPNIIDLNYTILRLAQQNPYTQLPLYSINTRSRTPIQ